MIHPKAFGRSAASIVLSVGFATNAARLAADDTSGSGDLMNVLGEHIQPYEESWAGYTWDQGNGSFMDFKFSFMLSFSRNSFPVREVLAPSAPGMTPNGETEGLLDLQGVPQAPDKWYSDRFWRPPGLPKWNSLRPYFGMNERAGQYWFDRNSAPVVEKEFNPLLFVRWWFVDPNKAPENGDAMSYGASLSDYVEFGYAHDSNGQYVDNQSGLVDQYRTYIDGKDNSTEVAYESARDNISRGWDYWELVYAQSGVLSVGDAHLGTLAFKGRWCYYPSVSFPQTGLEQYNPSIDLTEATVEALAKWAPGDPPVPLVALPGGGPRRYFDGLSMAFDFRRAPWKKPRYFYRYSITGTTGYSEILRNDTVVGEVYIVRFWHLPLSAWCRYGYNEDMIDYFQRSRSFGLRFSWDVY